MGRALLQLLELPWFSATPSWALLALLLSCPGAAGPAPPQPNATSPAGHRGAAVGASGIPLPGVPVPCIPISGVPIPGVSIPGVPVPGIPVSGISIPGVPVPGVSIPGILVPGAPVPGVPIPAGPLSAVPIPTGPGRRAAAGTWALPSPSLVSRLPASSSLLSLSLFSPSLVPHVPMERGSSLGLAYGSVAEPCKGLGPLLSPQNPLELCRAPQTGASGKRGLGAPCRGSCRQARGGAALVGRGLTGPWRGGKAAAAGLGAGARGEAGLGPAGLHELILGEREGCAPRPRASALPPRRTPAPAPGASCLGPAGFFPSRGGRGLPGQRVP